MPREIKFRVWDSLNKEMHYPDLSFFEEQSIRTFPEEYSNRFQIMQYTGLKDCKGTEIYEGDIVRLGYSDGSVYEKPVEVKFGLHRVGFDSDVCLGATALGFYFSPYPYTEDDEREIPMGIGETFDWDNDHIEVVGNIYEHRHLLD